MFLYITTNMACTITSDKTQSLSPIRTLGFDKPKVVSRSQSQELTTWFSLKSQCQTTPTTRKVSKKQDRAIHIIREALKKKLPNLRHCPKD